MPLPNLLHRVNCTIEQIDRTGTLNDDDAREPVQHAERSAAVTVQGQPKWVSEETLGTSRGGARSDSAGYVLFRYVDLNAAGVDLDINDRITIQGHIAAEVYVTKVQPIGHYADQNGASLVKAWFADRKPAKQRYS